MKPSRFRYERAESLEDALQLLASEADAKVLAGGQSLIALMNLRLASPGVVVDIGELDELRYVRREDAMLRVGALTTQSAVEHHSVVEKSCPLLAEAVGYIAHGAIRNRGTVGGSIAHADPAAELPLVLAAIDGEVTVKSSGGGARVVSANDFFRGFLMTAVEPQEIITEVAFPVADAHERFAFTEFARRPGDFALVAVACKLIMVGQVVRSAQVALGGLGATPVVLGGLSDINLPVARAAEVAANTAHEFASESTSDLHASSAYRAHLARALVKRAFQHATASEA